MPMKLNIEIKDFEISTGKITHQEDVVLIKFRRGIDNDVEKDILSLTSEYGWEVIDYRGITSWSKALDDNADFRVNCVGANSIEVGNAIAEYLHKEHGLTAHRIQRLTFKAGYSTCYIVQQFHSTSVVLSEDVRLW